MIQEEDEKRDKENETGRGEERRREIKRKRQGEAKRDKEKETGRGEER